VALAVDVLAPEGYGEIIGGSQREDDLNLLLAPERKTIFLRSVLIGTLIPGDRSVPPCRIRSG